MKKTLFIMLALTMGLGAVAQETDELDFFKLSAYETDNQKFSVDILSHLGVGFNIMATEDFYPSGGLDFFINIADLSFRPSPRFGVKAGIDFFGQEFSSQTDIFLRDRGGNIFVANPMGQELVLENYDSLRSAITTLGFSAPILLKGYFGRFVVGVGANLQFNAWGSTDYETVYRRDSPSVYQRATSYVRMRKAKVTPFTYSLMATLSYREFLSFYLRYYPSAYSIVPQHAVSPQFGLMTVGVALGF